MAEQKQPHKESALRAYVWCPMNNGQMLIEFNHGDTINDLLRVVREKWGIKLPTTKTPRGEMWAGWNVLGQTEDGSYVPLHIDDHIPRSPEELSSWMGWRDEPEEKDKAKAERDHYRWIISHGLHVDVGALHGRRGSSYDSLDRMVRAEHLEWPRAEDSADIKLCIVTAIAGG
jgi:hypothetical protein